MKLTLDQIPEDGFQREIGLEDRWARAAAEVALEGAAVALSGALEVRRFKRDLAVSGTLRASAQRTCDRCGEAVVLTVEGPLELTYVPDLSEAEGARELAGGELELGFYEEGALDLALVIQEHLALQLPQQVTCDLPGVTPPEGVPPCTPDLLKPPERGPDPRWAALAALKLGADSDN